MKIRNQILSIGCTLLTIVFLMSGCGDKDEPMVWRFTPGPDNQTEVQEALIIMADDDIIEFSEGTFEFTNTLSLDSKRGIIIRGAGRDLTTLSFANQTAGAEGFQISNCDWLLMRDLTVADAVGDNIKVKDGDGISFINLGAVYTGPVSGDNGAYALYPVSCKNVYVDNCYVRGASEQVSKSKTVSKPMCTTMKHVTTQVVFWSLICQIYLSSSMVVNVVFSTIIYTIIRMKTSHFRVQYAIFHRVQVLCY